jgi:hypothetical protein
VRHGGVIMRAKNGAGLATGDDAVIEAQKADAFSHARSSKPNDRTGQGRATQGGVTDNENEPDLTVNIGNAPPQGGVTDDEISPQDVVNIRNAARDGRHCARCGHEFAPGEAVWRYRIDIGRVMNFAGWRFATAPHCAKCKEGGWIWGGFSEPVACEGCGRTVHRHYDVRNSRIIACCARCRDIAHAAKAKAARTANREEKICLMCRKTFTPRRTDALYCGAACKQAAWRKMNALLDDDDKAQPGNGDEIGARPDAA